jgi:hypothetical protein
MRTSLTWKLWMVVSTVFSSRSYWAGWDSSTRPKPMTVGRVKRW